LSGRYRALVPLQQFKTNLCKTLVAFTQEIAVSASQANNLNFEFIAWVIIAKNDAGIS